MDDAIQELSNSQVQEQIALLLNEYPVVRLISKGDVFCSKCLLFEECGKMVAEELFDQGGGEKDWTLHLAGESFKATARHVSVAGLRHGVAYGVKATRKGFLVDIRHDKQEFIAAETHEHIGVAHASLHCFHNGMQRQPP